MFNLLAETLSSESPSAFVIWMHSLPEGLQNVIYFVIVCVGLLLLFCVLYVFRSVTGTDKIICPFCHTKNVWDANNGGYTCYNCGSHWNL
jgi:hypothetical protein